MQLHDKSLLVDRVTTNKSIRGSIRHHDLVGWWTVFNYLRDPWGPLIDLRDGLRDAMLSREASDE